MPALDWILGTTALISLTAGLLFGYQSGQSANASKPPSASPEMMQLLRDEHRLIENMVELRIASEKKLAYGEASD